MPHAMLMSVVGGSLSAVAWLSAALAVPGGLLFAYLAPLPMLMVGLAMGSRAAAIAAVSGVAVAATFGGLSAAEVFGGVHAMPVWLVAHQALLHRKSASGAAAGWLPVGTILASLAMISAFALTMTGVLAREDDGVEAAVRALLSDFVQIAPSLGPAPDTSVLMPLVPAFLGLMAVAWQVMIAINAVLAQTLLARRGWNRRPMPAWSAVQLPEMLSWLLVSASAAGLLASGDIAYLAQNAAIALAGPFFFVGLAAVHNFARRSAARGGVLLAFYVLLVVMFLVMAVLVTALGILDQWLGWRRGDGAANGLDRSE